MSNDQDLDDATDDRCAFSLRGTIDVRKEMARRAQ